MKNEKSNNLGRMSQENHSTSRNIQLDAGNQQKQSSQSSMPSSKYGSTSGKSSGPGRGWHGDAKGHAKAGSQSHKRTGNRHS
ncbi:hypothetical protein [Pontibacter sp. H249]|uniref:hypothetical protein n=1 Tax=Pontibacter sp. H249 TaxID=3133420 RepID=UPI0030BD5681